MRGVNFSKFWVPTLLVLLAASSASATLGGPENSAELDRQAFHGVRRVSLFSGYKVHEITTGTGTIREYVSDSGTVFGVAWKGLTHPDLSVLFGGYFGEYAQADHATVRPKGRAEVKVKSANLEVHRFGHMRAVRGRAWMPALVPSGFDVGLIQ